MAAPVQAPLLISADGDLPEPTAQALDALDPQGSKATERAQAFAIGDARGARRPARRPQVKGGEPGGARGRDRGPARQAVRRRRPTTSSSPRDEPAFAMPAAAWAARSATRSSSAAPRSCPRRRRTALKRHPKVPVYVLGPSSAISSDVVREDRQDRQPGAARLRRGPGRKRDRPGPLRRRRLRLERQRPRPRLRRRPQRRAARRGRSPHRSRPRAPGGRCCSPTTPIRCRRRCANTCSTSSRATRPTRRAPSTTTFG